jgi:ribosomal-protein-alanine N-acetyltransferase
MITDQISYIDVRGDIKLANRVTKLDSTNDVFTIDCQDIFLREYRFEDLDELCAITQQDEVLKFMPWWNATMEQRQDWMENYEIVDNKRFLKAVAENGDIGQTYLRLGIISKETEKFIGWCSTGIKEELPPPNREIFYGISEHYANKGYTTQAAQGLIKYLFENTGLKELNAIADIRNIPSNRVIQKCGFEFQSMIELGNEKYNCYKLYKM